MELEKLETQQATEVEMHCVKAAEEYAKNKDLEKEDIALLKEWVTTQQHLPAITEEMLILFHHACYFALEKAKKCIESYYTLRTNTPEIFTNRDVTSPDLAKALSGWYCTLLPKVSPLGYQLAYIGLRELEISKLMFVDNMKISLMTVDAYSRQQGTCGGVVFLVNGAGLSLLHLTRVRLGPLRKVLQYVQEGIPVRLKAIYVINVVPVVNQFVMLMRPFISDELMSLLHFHTGDMESFYQYIPKACLPRDLGGELASVEELCDEHNEKLASLAGYFLEEGKIRTDETKRQKGK